MIHCFPVMMKGVSYMFEREKTVIDTESERMCRRENECNKIIDSGRKIQ